MRTLWCKNQENPSDRISHAWAPLNVSTTTRLMGMAETSSPVNNSHQSGTEQKNVFFTAVPVFSNYYFIS